MINANKSWLEFQNMFQLFKETDKENPLNQRLVKHELTYKWVSGGTPYLLKRQYPQNCPQFDFCGAYHIRSIQLSVYYVQSLTVQPTFGKPLPVVILSLQG